MGEGERRGLRVDRGGRGREEGLVVDRGGGGREDGLGVVRGGACHVMFFYSRTLSTQPQSRLVVVRV